MNQQEILNILAEITDDDSVLTELDMDLFEEGLLDSLGVTELIVELEDRLNVTIPVTELKREDIRTPRLFVSYVQSKADGV